MVEIWKQNAQDLIRYNGAGFYCVLYAAAFVYLWRKEKETWRRMLFLYAPALLLFAFTVSPLRMLYARLLSETTTYYRLLWMMPFGMTVAYAAICLIETHRRIGLVLCCAAILLCGRLVYRSPYITRAENAYHLPQIVIEICDRIAPEKGSRRIRAAFPREMVYFVRQYNTDILMPFGRDLVEAQWSYYNSVYEVLERTEVIDMEALARVLRETACDYLILNSYRAITEDPTEYGYTEIDNLNGYRILIDEQSDLYEGQP